MYKKPKSTSDDNFVLVEEKKCNNNKIIQQQCYYCSNSIEKLVLNHVFNNLENKKYCSMNCFLLDTSKPYI